MDLLAIRDWTILFAPPRIFIGNVSIHILKQGAQGWLLKICYHNPFEMSSSSSSETCVALPSSIAFVHDAGCC